MLGEYNERDQSIDGFIFLIACRPNRDLLGRIETKLANLEKSGHIHQFDYQDFSDFLRQYSIEQSNFRLWRSGECLVRTSFDHGEGKRRRLDQILANQIFFFLKDSFHKHQHHHPTHDAIIPIYPVDSDGDQSWIEKTQYRLYRQIIRFKRYKDHKTLYRASGVLAYAQAFEQNFSESGRIKIFRTVELEKSLSVRRDEIYHFDQLRLNRQQTLVTWFFSVAALILSAAVLARLDRKVEISLSPIIPWITQSIASYPLAALGIAYAIARTLRMLAFSEAPSDWPLIRGIYQLLRGGSLSRFVAVMLILGIFVLFSAFGLVLFALDLS